MVSKKRFITDRDQRLNAKSTKEIFSHFKSWGIDLTEVNFASQLDGCYEYEGIKHELSKNNFVKFDDSYITNNYYDLLIILWNRLTPDKILLDNFIKKTSELYFDDDIQQIVNLWDDFMDLNLNPDFDTEMLETLLDYHEVQVWLDNFYHYIAQVLARKNSFDDYYDFDHDVKSISWPNKYIKYRISGLVIEASLHFINYNEERAELTIGSIIDKYLDFKYHIHYYYAKCLQMYDFNRKNHGIEKLEKTAIKHLQIAKSLTDDEVDEDMIKVIENHFQGGDYGLDSPDPKTPFNQDFSSQLLESLNTIMEAQDNIYVQLICFDCGLIYHAETPELYIDSKFLSNKNMMKTSTKPDNGRIMFPHEIKCPTCDGFKFVLDYTVKSLTLLPLVTNKDKRVRSLAIKYTLNNRLNTISSIMKDLVKRYNMNKNDADIIVRLANIYRKLNSYDKAKKLYLRAIKLKNYPIEAYFNLGEIYLGRSDLKRAIYCFNKIYENDKKLIKRIIKGKDVSEKTQKFVAKLNF